MTKYYTLEVSRPWDGDFSKDEVLENILGPRAASGAGGGRRDMEWHRDEPIPTAELDAIKTVVAAFVGTDAEVTTREYEDELAR